MVPVASTAAPDAPASTAPCGATEDQQNNETKEVVKQEEQDDTNKPQQAAAAASVPYDVGITDEVVKIAQQ